MKTKLIILTILIAMLISCGETDSEMFDRWMTELECPVILIGKTEKAVKNPSFVVVDGKGRVRTLASGNGDGWKIAAAIADSREIGDTLKFCNNE